MNVFLGAFDAVLSLVGAGEVDGSAVVALGDFAVVLSEPGNLEGVVGVVSVPKEVVGAIVDDSECWQPDAFGKQPGVFLDYVVVELVSLPAVVGESDVFESECAACWSIISHWMTLFRFLRMRRTWFIRSMDSTVFG